MATDELDAVFPGAEMSTAELAPIMAGVTQDAPDIAPAVPFPPPGAELVTAFTVLGDPAGAGSKVSGVATRKDPVTGKRVPILRENGMPKTFTKDSSGGKGKTWRQEVAAAAFAARQRAGQTQAIREVPLVLEVTFFRPRNQGHHGTGRNAGVLKGSAPAAPFTRPDALKLARAVEDAITSSIWHDDSQIVDGRQRKVYGEPARAEVRVWRLPATVADVRAAAITVPDDVDDALQVALPIG